RTPLEARRALRGPWWLTRWLVEHQGRARLLCKTLCGGRPVVPQVARLFATEHLPADVVEDAFLHHWDSLSQTLASYWTGAELPERYRTFPRPVIALHGEDDVCVPVENLTDAAESRPWLTVETLPEEGFNVALTAPDAVAEVVAEAAHRATRPRPLSVVEGAADASAEGLAPLSVAEAAALARVSRRTVQTWVKAKVVAAERSGGRWRIDRGSLLAHLFGDETGEADRLLASPWLSTAEAASRLGVSHVTVARLVTRGLPSHRVAGRRVFLRAELDAWRAP
ncbi:MAG: helix-turn-helix domain-containing protein, partial [Egibacteraceae bacterium]